MRDNRKNVAERLGKLALRSRREEEIIRELSDHVEDHAAALEAHGMAPDEAAQEALASVSNWSALRSEIVLAEAAEGGMNYRTKVLWLPALGALILSSSLLAVFQFFGVVPRFYWLSARMSVEPYFTIYIPWLVALPIVGGVSALWSRRVGGRAIHQLLAALSPSIGLLGFFLVSPFLTLLIYELLPLMPHGPAHRIIPLTFHAPPITAIAVVLVSWVLLPATGLMLGAMPFLRKTQPQS